MTKRVFFFSNRHGSLGHHAKRAMSLHLGFLRGYILRFLLCKIEVDIDGTDCRNPHQIIMTGSGDSLI